MKNPFKKSNIRSVVKKRRSVVLTIGDAVDLVLMNFTKQRPVHGLIHVFRYDPKASTLAGINYESGYMIKRMHDHKTTLKITRHPIAKELGHELSMEDDQGLVFIATNPIKMKEYESKNQ